MEIDYMQIENEDSDEAGDEDEDYIQEMENDDEELCKKNIFNCLEKDY